MIHSLVYNSVSQIVASTLQGGAIQWWRDRVEKHWFIVKSFDSMSCDLNSAVLKRCIWMGCTMGEGKRKAGGFFGEAP